MKLGNLGTQIALLSENAFAGLSYVDSIKVASGVYYPLKMHRDETARMEYKHLQNTEDSINGTYLLDIIRRGL